MIIKSMSRTSGSSESQFNQLLNYVASPSKDRQDKEIFGTLLDYFGKPDGGQAILHNLRTQQEDLSAILAEFEANAKFLSSRKGGVILYHEIISFHQEDRDQLDPTIIADLAKTYLRLRAPMPLVLPKPIMIRATPIFILSFQPMIYGQAKNCACPKLNFSRSRSKWNAINAGNTQH